MYIPYDNKNLNFLDDIEFVCNGCGHTTIGHGQMNNHLDQCTISKLRIHLDKKTNGKAKFTNVEPSPQ